MMPMRNSASGAGGSWADFMRLWTLHPKYLDARGLVALWREALLAQAVLNGRTKGYTHHPQLIRFRASPDPVATIAVYLEGVYAESVRRGYRFDKQKVGSVCPVEQIPATSGQLEYEWKHLLRKLKARDAEVYRENRKVVSPEAHSLFRIVSGGIADWEVVKQ